MRVSRQVASTTMDDKVRADIPRYEIGTVARLSGVSAQRLRIWERRYGLGPSFRDGNGRRLYNRNELEHVQLVAALVRAGKRIGQIAALPGKTLAALLDQQYLQGKASDGPASLPSAGPVMFHGARRWFSGEELRQLPAATGDHRCECRRQLCDLLQQLYAFEDYARDCAADDWQAASLHAALYSHALQARNAMEQALATLLADHA